MGAQAPFSFRLQAGLLPPPSIAYGPSMMRYNRVEGLSLGASVEQQLGGGYSGSAIGRIGFADWQPNVELSLTRSNITKSVGVSAYNRLVSASDWGHPLEFWELVLRADVWSRRGLLLSRHWRRTVGQS